MFFYGTLHLELVEVKGINGNVSQYTPFILRIVLGKNIYDSVEIDNDRGIIIIY